MELCLLPLPSLLSLLLLSPPSFLVPIQATFLFRTCPLPVPQHLHSDFTFCRSGAVSQHPVYNLYSTTCSYFTDSSVNFCLHTCSVEQRFFFSLLSVQDLGQGLARPRHSTHLLMAGLWLVPHWLNA
jgi:hypothetical protein